MPSSTRMLLASLALACLAFSATLAANTFSTSVSSFSPGGGTFFGGFGDKKIIGGLPSSITEHPYLAAVTIIRGKSYQHQCGGSILDKYHILSAAHCFENPNAYFIRVGSDYWRYQGQGSKVKSIMVHPKYNNNTFDYDVAVLRLSKAIKIDNKKTKATSLVKVNTVTKADTVITLIGWGYEDALHSRPIPAKLRAVDIAVTDQEECEADYSAFERDITSRMICGMSTDGELKDSCQGDSGGPVMNKKTKQQIGIISWGMGCAQMGSPGIFTNLANSEVRSFINTCMKK